MPIFQVEKRGFLDLLKKKRIFPLFAL